MTQGFLLLVLLASLLASCLAMGVGERLVGLSKRSERHSLSEQTGCKCNSTVCSCCADINVPVFHQSVCARLVWLQQRLSISVRIDWNDGVLFERVYNTSHPASCAHVPILGDVCFALDNYTITSTGACGLLELDFVLFFSTYTFPFGDFQFGDVRRLNCPTGAKQVKISPLPANGKLARRKFA